MNPTYGSVCSGIEAASLAWHSLGWKPAWFSEIEPFPAAVLAHRWPHVTNLGDMTKIAAGVRAGHVQAPDILVGGTPCQAFSVAGLRGGLSDARGQITLSYVELANTIDAKRHEHDQRPAVIVWENVPGVLNDKTNAFGCFLAGLAGEDRPLRPAGGKWTNAGAVYGPQRAIAWRILDAQFVGVAQRRRRVFVVASARPDFDPCKVLFEFDRLRRDIAPSREAGQATSALTANGAGTCGADDNQARGGHLVPHKAFRMVAFGEYADDEAASTCKARDYKDATDLAVAFNWQAGGNTASDLGASSDFTGALQASQTPAVCVTGDFTHPLRAEGYDGSEDGTGRGTPVIAFGSRGHGQDVGWDVSPTILSGNVDAGAQPPAIICTPNTLAVRGRGGNASLEYRQDGIANALLTPNGDRCGIGVGAVAFAIAENSRGEVRFENGDGQITGVLSAGGGKPGQGKPVVISISDASGRVKAQNGKGWNDTGTSYTLDTVTRQAVAVCLQHAQIGRADNAGPQGKGGLEDLAFTQDSRTSADVVQYGMHVRRLMPVECERLQGMPDDHTKIPWRNKSAEKCPDAPRYKAIGNSMAVPCMVWIGNRIKSEGFN